MWKRVTSRTDINENLYVGRLQMNCTWTSFLLNSIRYFGQNKSTNRHFAIFRSTKCLNGQKNWQKMRLIYAMQRPRKIHGGHLDTLCEVLLRGPKLFRKCSHVQILEKFSEGVQLLFVFSYSCMFLSSQIKLFSYKKRKIKLSHDSEN